jgi:hypothetical protein
MNREERAPDIEGEIAVDQEIVEFEGIADGHRRDMACPQRQRPNSIDRQQGIDRDIGHATNESANL